MTRRPVDVAPLLGEQVHAADEEGEVRVGPSRDGAPVRPESRPAGAVEGDDHELRGAAPARSGRRRRGTKRDERRRRRPGWCAAGLDLADGDECRTEEGGEGEREAHAPIVR